jgi:hypothetical protein
MYAFGGKVALRSALHCARHFGPPKPLALCLGPAETGADALPDHRAFKLSECPADLKHQATSWRSRVDRLLVKIQVNATCFEMLDCAQQVDQRAPEPIDRPSHHDVEPALAGGLEHVVEARSLSTPFGARDAGVGIDCHDLPPTPLSHAL